MKRGIIAVCIVTILVPRIQLAEEAQQGPPPAEEKRLKLAHAFAEHSDYRNAITIFFNIMRHSENNDLRNNARNSLEQLGFSSQELFQLEPEKLKGEEMEKLIARTATTMSQRQKQEIDLEYAKHLLNIAVSPHIGIDGQMQVDVQSKELIKALTIMMELALGRDDNGGREAQGVLEEIGVTGERVTTVKAALQAGSLPTDVQNEMVATICMNMVHNYREMMQEDPNSEDHDIHERVGKQIGSALYKYMEKHFAETAVMKRPSDVLDFWREKAVPQVPANF